MFGVGVLVMGNVVLSDVVGDGAVAGSYSSHEGYLRVLSSYYLSLMIMS
jgi:hypothetical protein